MKTCKCAKDGGQRVQRMVAKGNEDRKNVQTIGDKGVKHA